MQLIQILSQALLRQPVNHWSQTSLILPALINSTLITPASLLAQEPSLLPSKPMIHAPKKQPLKQLWKCSVSAGQLPGTLLLPTFSLLHLTMLFCLVFQSPTQNKSTSRQDHIGIVERFMEFCTASDIIDESQVGREGGKPEKFSTNLECHYSTKINLRPVIILLLFWKIWFSLVSEQEKTKCLTKTNTTLNQDRDFTP